MGEGAVRLELVHEQPFVGVLHGGDSVHPLPAPWDAVAAEEVSAEQEEEGGEGDDGRIPEDEVGNDGADEDDEGVGGQQRHVEHDEKVEEAAAEAEREPDYAGVGGGLQEEEGEVGDEAGGSVGGGAVGIVGGLANEDEALLDEGWDGVVGGEEEEADGEDEEAEAVGDALGGVLGLEEHGGHHQAHNGQHHLAGQKQLRRAPDVGEVAPHQYPHLPAVGVGELGAQDRLRILCAPRAAAPHVRALVVILVHSVVAAVGRRRARQDLVGVGVVARR